MNVWLLPSRPDPEAEAIEALLSSVGQPVAKSWDDPTVQEAHRTRGPIYAIERDDWPEWALGDRAVMRIDHHEPGDLGYESPPEEFLLASSVGQVIGWLARWDLLPPSWEREQCRSGNDAPNLGEFLMQNGWVVVTNPEAEDSYWVAKIPHDIVLCAAADQCLGAAYRGECPGVDPDALMAWRAESKARFQGRPVADVLADVERAREALRLAQGIALYEGCSKCDSSGRVLISEQECGDPQCGCGQTFAECDACGGNPPKDIIVRDMRRPSPIPELPEAAMRYGYSYISGPLIDPRNQRPKYTVSGTPEVVHAWLEHWAPANGIVDPYGVPERGFGGGYLA